MPLFQWLLYLTLLTFFGSCFFGSKIEELENEVEEAKTAFEIKKLALDR